MRDGFLDSAFDVFLAIFGVLVLLFLASLMGLLVWSEWQEMRAEPCVCEEVQR